MHVYQVTKYDPAHFGERGYFGPEDVKSDHGRLEAAYLSAVEVFAQNTGVTELTIREPELAGIANFGLEPHVAGHGLAGLFPPDLTGFHDGARLTVATGIALVRAMLRSNGAWCRLESDERFFVHVGYDQYMYVGSSEPCDEAVACVRTLGLFPVPLDRSPYELRAEELDDLRPADDAFWTELTQLALDCGTVILEEVYVGNASRWHRLRAGDVTAIRSGLTPRARLIVWPELNDDVTAELRTLEDHGLATVVWENRDGQITDLVATDEDYPFLRVELARASAAMVVPGHADEYHPLLTAALPDDDGVVRIRWSE